MFVRDLARLSPFGIGNHKPLFALEVVPDDVQIFGKTKNHTKLKLSSPNGKFDAIAFFKLPEDFSNEPESLKPVTLLAHVERSHFMGRLETRLRIVDIL
jgi:single-stranded-DNA-specific exonuclease